MSAASLDASTVARKPTARERLLAAADDLFYAEGVHTVGIDRIIERAGVAKASLYSSFGSKDELVRAYLQGREERRQARILSKLERYDSARAKLLGIFEVQAEAAASPQFRGCAFYNASAESAADGPAIEVSDSSRAWTRRLMTDLAREAGVPDPQTLAAQLVILYDGANVGARMDRNPATGLTARTVASALLDAALA
jgi:AcrR family transcriptional regulator